MVIDEKHRLSNFTVLPDGNIFVKTSHLTINEDFALLYDADTGTVIKYGNRSKVEKYMVEAGKALALIGSSFSLIVFSELGVLSKDDICTLAGWLCNTISAETFYMVLHESEEDLRKRIDHLQSIGW